MAETAETTERPTAPAFAFLRGLGQPGALWAGSQVFAFGVLRASSACSAPPRQV